MKQSRQNEQGTQVLATAGWSAASFRIRTADGWFEVDGIVCARRSALTSGPPTRPATRAGL